MDKKQTHTFHVNGMHCKSCALITEHTLDEVAFVEKAKVNAHKQSVSVSGDFGDKTKEEIAEDLTKKLSPKGYSLSTEKEIVAKKWEEFWIAGPLAALFVLLFILLQKMGLVNLMNTSEMTFYTPFIIGVVASLSSCMAVVGGLVLSMSATFAKEGDRIKPQLLFHAGRIVSFFLLGGMIGAIGSAFQLNAFGSFFLSFLVGTVMLIMGINLLDIFHGAKRFQITMPKFLSMHALKASNMAHTVTPLLVGVATFFLPCGFTQSMQIYALSTGDFLKGGLTMLFFALGTFPALAVLSFSGAGIAEGKQKGVFFKTAGLIVIVFAIFNIINSLVIIGAIKSVFTF
ncbi:MAG: sulfite exporter TauE/SafE family protein [Candidatus Paceibacterota bacterium]